jgi:hypothetical protein
MPLSAPAAYVALIPTLIVLLINYVGLRRALRRLRADPNDATAQESVRRRRAWAWPLLVLTYLLLLLAFFLDRYAFFVLAVALAVLPLWRRNRIEAPRRYFVAAAIMVFIGFIWPFSSFRDDGSSARVPPVDEAPTQVEATAVDGAAADDREGDLPDGGSPSTPAATGSATDAVDDQTAEAVEVDPVDSVVPSSPPFAPSSSSASQASSSAQTASTSVSAEPPVASPPPQPAAVEPAVVAFVIESHPVAAPIYVSTNPAREVERQMGTGTATVEVAPGTEIVYSIRPAAGSGFEPFYGRLTVEQAATHPVWLTPVVRAEAPSVQGFAVGTAERAVADWFAAYAREDWNAMVNMSLPSQLNVGDGRQMAFNTIEGTYFFREFRRLESIERISGDDFAARIRVVWQHDIGRSQSTLMVIRENPRGQPDRSAPWRISYLSAVGVQDLR